MRYPILAGFMNLATSAFRYDGPTSPGTPVPLRAKVAPPGLFSSEDAAQLVRLQAAKALGPPIEGTIAETTRPAPAARPAKPVLHAEREGPEAVVPAGRGVVLPPGAPERPIAPPMTQAEARRIETERAAAASRGEGGEAGDAAAQAQPPGNGSPPVGLGGESGRGGGDGAEPDKGRRRARKPRQEGPAG